MSTTMTNWRQSPAGVEYGSEWASNPLVAASRPLRIEIPVGTVASRIIDLQNLAKSSGYNGPQTVNSRRRESSRTDSGRRRTTKLGQASRSSRPDEDAPHGLAAPRNSHMEEYATTGPRAKLDRTAGPQARFMLGVFGTRVENEVSSLPDLSPSSHSKEDIKRHNEGRRGGFKDAAIRLDDSIPNPVLPGSLADGAAENEASAVDHRHEHTTDLGARPGNLHQERPESSSESFSGETTSTMRRQSVRELYAYYGIRRPPGLVSPENFSGTSIDSSPDKHVCCHVCFQANSLKSTYCKCGHKICAACEGILSDAGSRRSWSVEGTKSTQKFKGDYAESNAASNAPPELKIELGGPRQGKLPNGGCLGEERHTDKSHHDLISIPGHEPLGLAASVPKLRGEGARLPHGSRRHNAACRELFDPMTHDQRSAMAKDEPELITTSNLISTDALLPGYSLGLLPVVMSTGSRPKQTTHCPHRLSSSQRHKSTLKSTPNEQVDHDCEIPYYKVIQLGHSDNRKGNCPRKSHRRGDEAGQATVASHLDERNSIGHANPPLEEDLRCSGHDHNEAKSIKQNVQAATTPHTELERPKQIYSEHLKRGGTCSSEITPVLPKHADIHMPPKDGHVRKGNPSPLGSIEAQQHQEQCLHDLSQRTHDDGRCYKHQSFSSSHTVRQDQYIDSLRMAPQAQSLTSSSKASPRKPSSDTGNDNHRPIATPNSHRSENGIRKAAKAAAVELQVEASPGMSSAQKQRFSKETFVTLKRKFETEPELEVAHLPKETSPHSTNQVDASQEPDIQTTLPEDRPSYENRSLKSKHPSSTCSSYKHMSTSRRLSAFFRLQEENIVSTLNRRLQEHQEELKRMESLCNDQLKLVSQRNAPIAEEGPRREGGKRVEEQLVGSHEQLTDRSEDFIPSRPEQRKIRNEKGQEVMLLGLDTPKITVETHWDNEHRHKCGRVVVQNTSKMVDSPGKFQEERYVGVNGITITIHMDGREDIVIKADFSG